MKLFQDDVLNKTIAENARQTIHLQYNFEKTVENSLLYYQKTINN